MTKKATSAKPKPIYFWRTLPDNSPLACLGHASKLEYGWYFFPNVVGRKPSTKARAKWEECVPRWVGYPDKCRSGDYYGKPLSE